MFVRRGLARFRMGAAIQASRSREHFALRARKVRQRERFVLVKPVVAESLFHHTVQFFAG
jgi:hypothetical protein